MINCFICTGRLTAPVELKSSRTGKSVCDFSLACENRYGDNKQVDFLDFKAWNNIAELMSRLEKGTVVAIQAQAKSEKVKTKDRTYNNKYFLVKELHIMSKRGEYMPQDPYEQPAPSYASPSDFEEIVDNDDDMPF